MELLIALLGCTCVAWTGIEVGRALRGPAPVLGFGAVDLDGDRPLDVVLDRRVNDRRRESGVEQPGCSLHV